jgi:hypothetical protein
MFRTLSAHLRFGQARLANLPTRCFGERSPEQRQRDAQQRRACQQQVDRKNVTKSGMSRIVGTPDYKQITMRSANTMRKLNEMLPP